MTLHIPEWLVSGVLWLGGAAALVWLVAMAAVKKGLKGRLW